MKRRYFRVVGVLGYMCIIVLLYRNKDSIYEYTNRITESSLGMGGIVASFLAVLAGIIEYLCTEVRGLYTVEYYACFDKRKGFWYALKSKFFSVLLLEIIVLLYSFYCNSSFWIMFFLSVLVAVLLFAVIYEIVKTEIRTGAAEKHNKIKCFAGEAKTIIGKNVFCQELIGKLKILDAMIVRLIIVLIIIFLSRHIGEKNGLYNLLFIGQFLITICGERYIKGHIHTVLYLFTITNHGRTILWKYIGIDCLINVIVPVVLAIFTRLGIEGGILLFVVGCALTIYWDIFFMWTYAYDYSAGIVAILAMLAAAIMLIPIANVIFCYKSYCRLIRRKNIFA